MQSVTIDLDPDEIHVDDTTAIHHTKAYIVLQMPADGKCRGIICAKVDTKYGGDIMPLCVFQHLHYNQVGANSTPSGLCQQSTRLTSYNSAGMTQYGIFYMRSSMATVNQELRQMQTGVACQLPWSVADT